MNYLLSASLLLLLLTPAYFLLFRYSERYVLNRLLLLLGLITILTLPTIEVPSPIPVATQVIKGSIEYLERSSSSGESVSLTTELREIPTSPETGKLALSDKYFGFGFWLTTYFVAALLFFGMLLLRVTRLLTVHFRSRPALSTDDYRLLPPGSRPGQAFTFGRRIYLSEDVANDLDLDVVLAHEKIHAQQLHTVDILLSELFVCVFWFHPVAWWLRTKLRANLEYLVDANVVRRMNKRTYQLALVRQSQRAYGLALALPFSEPSLKGRIKRLGNLPRHWIVAVVSAVGLLFWLGMTALVMRGTVSPNQSIQFDTSSYHVNLYLKRLPYPNELAAIREVLPVAREFQISFYQSCLDAPEVYSFEIGKLNAPDRNRSNAKLGVYFDHNFRQEIQATPILGSSSGQTFYGDIDWPTDAPSGEIALQINGNWQKLPAPVVAAYRSDQLDTPPPNEKLVCLLEQYRKNYHDSFLWNMSIKGKSVDETTLKEMLLESNIVGNPIHYYLEDKQVSTAEFFSWRLRKEETFHLGALTYGTDKIYEGPVIARIYAD